MPGMPKVKRGIPVMPSIPIKEQRKPRQALIRPFKARSFTMPMMMIMPIIMVRNSSRGPNLVAMVARGGAMNISARHPTTPPTKEERVVTPMAFRPCPFRVMG